VIAADCFRVMAVVLLIELGLGGRYITPSKADIAASGVFAGSNRAVP
jgi:hypothetical protein